MIAQDQLIGARFEKCVVERLIGRGGYGLTFLAFDEELQEHRVIKVSQDEGLDETTRRRHIKSFLEEGLILSRLKHPQIVTLRGQGDKHGHRYMILDYIQGYSLRNVLDIVKQRQEELGCAWRDLMDPSTATALLLSALYPLEYAHRANVHLPDREIFGVAHRDIAPGNLILGVKGNEKGRLILIDFGTAKTDLTENITVDQNLVGTVPYMGKARLQKANSPEEMAVYQDFWRDFRETQHDIHALGVLYYQLLTGRLPFSGETSPQIIVKILDPECYSQCHLEIASAHPYASAVLRKCLVFHDFTQPLSEQPYQYPDAASMLPEVVGLFDALSSGNSVNEILVGLGKKLARPEHWLITGSPEGSGGTPSTDLQSSIEPKTLVRYPELPFPMKSDHRLALSLITLICVVGLTVAGMLWFNSSKPNGSAIGLSKPNPISTSPPLNKEFVPPRTALEKLDGPQVKPGQNLAKTNPAPLKKLPSKDAIGAKFKSSKNSLNGTTETIDAIALSQENPDLLPLNKDIFVQLQTLVREEDPSAYDRITGWLIKDQTSPDLRLLKCQLVLRRNPAASEARQDLAGLLEVRPEFTHPILFRESVMHLLFQTDVAIYETQKTPVNRVRLQKSGNAYLAEFQPNPVYEEKVRNIRAELAK